ncbi:MAG: hypothetical protein RR543_04305 [Erysipelotrichales bacterium]
MSEKDKKATVITVMEDIEPLEFDLAEGERQIDIELEVFNRTVHEIITKDFDKVKAAKEAQKHLDTLYSDLLMYDSVDSQAERYFLKRRAVKKLKDLLYDMYIIDRNS